MSLQPEFVAPFVLAITHPDGIDANGRVFEVGAGYIAEIRWERSKGQAFKCDKTFTPSAVSEPLAGGEHFLILNYIGARKMGADH